jgi:hypothetical protein
LISKADRYKPYPVAGAGLMMAGLLVLSRVDRGTSAVLVALDMIVIGIGIGLVMQVVILVAQNHAPRRHIGVATSTVTFARSIGATIGVAIFGAIFASRLGIELASSSPAAQRIAGAGARLDPEQVRALPASVHTDVIDAFTRALHVTFEVGAGFGAVALLAVLVLPRALHPGEAEPAGALGGAGAAA